ncbi:carboxymuconolactone decarboxylase family protein [Streptomyces sp. NBC_01716]|uniref:carboxymuconolactone decarboxylase family protein n=1 Tax=Streptomyces sp. NBC_01716 TaxID=2975917 RepID=UPI002E33E25E|nr:carboxymuconolactone decarboxylase family protein [Streptomyces sp. NBC_01716]
MNQHNQRYEEGLRIRREVMGAAHVEHSMAAADEFTLPVQEMVTEFCWGGLWSREGLDRKTRSMLNLVILAALNRNHELAAHVRGAVTNGCTETEIRESLLHTVIYCGAPAGLEAFRVADSVLEELRDRP